MVEDQTFTITAEDGTTDEMTLPAGLLDRLVRGDQTGAEALGDLATLAVTQQVHGLIHHGPDTADDELLALEEAVMERFEARFGTSFGEMTGHSH